MEGGVNAVDLSVQQSGEHVRCWYNKIIYWLKSTLDLKLEILEICAALNNVHGSRIPWLNFIAAYIILLLLVGIAKNS
jgi:hypothetical protein